MGNVAQACPIVIGGDLVVGRIPRQSQHLGAGDVGHVHGGVSRTRVGVVDFSLVVFVVSLARHGGAVTNAPERDNRFPGPERHPVMPYANGVTTAEGIVPGLEGLRNGRGKPAGPFRCSNHRAGASDVVAVVGPIIEDVDAHHVRIERVGGVQGQGLPC